MTSLEQLLQQPPDHLRELLHNAGQAVAFLAANTALGAVTPTHSLYRYEQGDKPRQLRPVKTSLFISDANEFDRLAEDVCQRISDGVSASDRDYGARLDQVLYTAVQACACVFDAKLGDAAARKLIGGVFSSLVRSTLREAGVATRMSTLLMRGSDWTYHYQCDILASRDCIRSSTAAIDPADVVLSCMTTTKDRLAKIFADKLLLERYLGHALRFGVVALHDVQRKGDSEVTWTFLPNVFLMNSQHLTPLLGLYYLDVPETATGTAFQAMVRPFHEIVVAFPG